MVHLTRPPVLSHNTGQEELYSWNSGSTLHNIIMEDTLEPCHLHLVLSTSLIALALAAVNITKQKTILLDLLITLGEGEKALKCLP